MNIEQWKVSHYQDRINYSAQLGRVIYVLTNSEKALTLREIESRIWAKFPHRDTQAAISARLREVSPVVHGLVKTRKLTMENGKQVHRYSLVPFTPVKEVAEKVGVTA
ncbi:hypothetical protein ACNPDE_002117 [Vibrio fluvialis]